MLTDWCTPLRRPIEFTFGGVIGKIPSSKGQLIVIQNSTALK